MSKQLPKSSLRQLQRLAENPQAVLLQCLEELPPELLVQVVRRMLLTALLKAGVPAATLQRFERLALLLRRGRLLARAVDLAEGLLLLLALRAQPAQQAHFAIAEKTT